MSPRATGVADRPAIKADAVLAASIFHFGTYSIREVKEYLAAAGLPVRPVQRD